MGKPADPSLRLRCVHCLSTETPLWRAGPDGPKTLCNACGVRYKKGKLVLYKDPKGNITAVKRNDADPVHVPPAPKKPSKKAAATPTPPPPPAPPVSPSPPDIFIRRTVRKVPSEGAIAAAAVAKKPRSRSRRTNAGQMPGRYASKTLPESMSHWRSPSSSPKSSPSSPAESPRIDGSYHGLLSSPTAFKMDEPSLYQFTDPEEENMFPDVACLGIDSVGDSDNLTLLPMPADPSSAEQFTFAFAELGRDASLDIDLPDRVEALRGLVLDRTRKVSRSYDAAVAGLCRLCEQRQLRAQSAENGKQWTIEDCKNYVRLFAQDQNVGLLLSADELKDLTPGSHFMSANGTEKTAGLMLSEKTAYSSAVENFRALMDSTELVGFAEACMVELLAEDVVLALTKQGFSDFGNVSAFRRRGQSLPTKPIAVRG